MLKVIGLIVAFSSCSVAAAATELEPLAFLAGQCWKGSFPGGTRTDQHCFTWIYGGKFLRDRHTLHTVGKPDGLGETIYYWNSAAKQLEYLYIESGGGYSHGGVTVEKDFLGFPETALLENGDAQIYRSRWTRLDNTAYQVLTEFKVDGEWVPGFQVDMRRSRKPSEGER
jgi:hypothetical protein